MKIMFVPVSSKQGIGEYMRSTILADTIQQNWPEAQIKFVLSKQAPYVESCEYEVLLTDKSPTFHPKTVNEYISEFKPDLVIFDAAGRASNLKHAKKEGAKTVFLAHYDKKIRRALSINRLLYTDQIWVSQPRIAVSPLSWFSTAKLKLFKKEPLRYLGSIYQQPKAEFIQSVLEKYNLERESFLLISAGSGGHKIESGELAADAFYQSVKKSSIETKLVQVWGANYCGEDIPSSDEVECHISSISNLEFISLLQASKMALISGGDTLLQAIALRIPLLAVPISSDQPARIKTLLSYGQPFLTSAGDLENITTSIEDLDILSTREALRKEMARLDVTNGNQIVLNNIKELLNS